MTLSIGIDLGTTNSVAAVATETGVEFVTCADGHRVHSSVVAYPPSGEIVVGREAFLRRANEPTSTIYSAKRLIGQNIRAPLVQLALTSLPYTVEEGDNQQPIIAVGNRRLDVPGVSSEVLRYLKTLAEQQFGQVVRDAVITVPANFSDSQRQATKEAGRIAGLEVLRLVNEPTAAALAYGYGENLDQRIAVFDLGGGTFDVSVLRIHQEIFEVLATDGDFFLGGDDFDRALSEFLAGEINKKYSLDPRPFPAAMTRVNMAAEQIKCHLSRERVAEGTIDGLVVEGRNEPLSMDFRITRRQFNNLIAGYVDRAIEVCRNVMHAAGLGADDLDEIICVGGSTRVVWVRERIAEVFGKEPKIDVNPDEVVAQGAAIQAGSLSQKFARVHNANDGDDSAGATAISFDQPLRPEDFLGGSDPLELLPDGLASQAPAASIGSPVLMDVTPASLRVVTVGGYTEELLEKNAPIPIERSQIFATAHDNQTKVTITCCRGESNRADDNEPLGEVELSELPAAPRGSTQIEVTFRVDTDGILHVRARDKNTGRKQEASLNVLGAPTATAKKHRSGKKTG